MPRARLAIPSTLTCAIVSAAFVASCSQSPTPIDADRIDAPDVAADDIAAEPVDIAFDTEDAGIDAPDDDVSVADTAIDSADADIDCFTVCVTEIFPGPDGSLQNVVYYADGAMSYDAICDVPPPPPQCGV